MSRAALLALAALGVLAACGDSSSPAPTIAFRQPAALAVFYGFTLDAPGSLRPYLVVANSSRNDLTVIDATDDTPVAAPIQLRALAIPVPDRPALLAAASLGDGEADLLVAVSAGSSGLQLVRTWTHANDVVEGATVDLGADVLAVAALPTSPQTAGTARVAVALAGAVGGGPGEAPEIAIVEYARVDADGSIEPGAVTRSAPLAFQPLALAALPDDPDAPGLQTEIYAATRDEIEPGIFGVAALSADLASVRALDARGPTRLVGAARLRERVTAGPAATASDGTAFDGQPRVGRAYAVLDEEGCGPTRRVDCGVVTLDPDAVLDPGEPDPDHLPADWAGRMPYRAPMRVPGRVLALAVAQPPAVAPPENAAYAGELMRLAAGPNERATTGVAAAASEDGFVYFLDLGRFETATGASPVATRAAGTPISVTVDPTAGAAPPVSGDEARLWVLASPGDATFPETDAAAAAAVEITPGYTPTERFTVSHQGFLPGLDLRTAHAGVLAGQRWLAMQSGTSGAPTGAVRLFHPALGVKDGPDGDIAVLAFPGVPAGCEARVESFLAPRAEFPGGAVALAEEPGGACVAALYADLVEGQVRRDVVASIRARALLLSGAILGYAGRPQRGLEYALEYPATLDPADPQDEDALARACPVADWDGRFPVTVDVTCGGTCDRSAGGPCERLVLARKARRVHHLSYPCEDQECRDRFPGVAFPEANGPAVAFTVDVQRCPSDGVCETARPSAPLPPLLRGMQLSVTPGSGVLALAAPRPSPASPFHPSGAIAFDRSRPVAGFPGDPAAGYRFLVSYPADLVVDVSPSVTPVGAVTIR